MLIRLRVTLFMWAWVWPPPVSTFPSMYTLEIAGGNKECYYEFVNLEDKHTGHVEFSFDVLDGGDHTIELDFSDPDGNTYFDGERRRQGALNYTVSASGLFTICFSNEFSYFTPKTVRFELEFYKDRSKVLSEFYDTETMRSLEYLNDAWTIIHFIQKGYRTLSTHNWKTAEELNTRVQRAAILMTIGMLVISIAQVSLLKRLFQDNKKTLKQKVGHPFHLPPVPQTIGLNTPI